MDDWKSKSCRRLERKLQVAQTQREINGIVNEAKVHLYGKTLERFLRRVAKKRNTLPTAP